MRGIPDDVMSCSDGRQHGAADATISPADAGPCALANSVVFETVDPEDVLRTGAIFWGNVRPACRDNGRKVQGALMLAGRTEGLSWLGYGKRGTGEDHENGDGDRVCGTEADLTSGLAKIAWKGKGQDAAPVPANFGSLNGHEATCGFMTRPATAIRWRITLPRPTRGGIRNSGLAGPKAISSWPSLGTATVCPGHGHPA